MNRNIVKLKLLLATMGLSRSDLKKLLLDFSREPVESLVDDVEKIALHARSGTEYTGDADDRDVILKVSNDSNVGMRVERLLRKEANLSSAKACRVLSAMLLDAGLIKEQDIPPLSKKSLHVWVDKILPYVPAKDLLRLATIARNNFVHKPKSDWSLG